MKKMQFIGAYLLILKNIPTSTFFYSIFWGIDVNDRFPFTQIFLLFIL